MAHMNLDQLKAKAAEIRSGEQASASPSSQEAPPTQATSSETDPAPEAQASGTKDETPTPGKSDDVAQGEGEADASSSASADGAQAADGSGKPEPTGSQAEGAETPPASAAYTANFKYKVTKPGTDEQEEREIPELLRSVMKDPESEKFVRDLVTRADGLEVVKARFQQSRQEFKDIQSEFAHVVSGTRQLGGMLRQGKFDEFFETLGIPKENVFRWVLDHANYQQASPEEKARIDRERAALKQAEEAESHSHESQQAVQEAVTRAKVAEARLVLSQPEVSSFRAMFDEKFGPNAFVEEVLKLGKHVWNEEGRDLPVDEAAKKIMSHYGKVLSAPASAAAPTPAQGAPAQGATAGQAQATPAAKPPVIPNAATKTPPTIPNLQGGTQSPTKQRVKSLDDLKRIRKEIQERDSGL